VKRLEQVFRQAVADLAEIKARWALVGGLAVSVLAEPRFTRDLDLALAVAGDRQAEAVASSLLGRGYRLQATVEQTAAGRLATVRLLPPGEQEEGVVLDLLFASSGIEPEIIEAAEVLEVWPGLRAPVIRLGHLVALKLLSRSGARPQDQADLVALLARAEPQEIRRAQEALSLIAERGFHRGKNLEAEFEQLLEDR
jgi:nucleotidyltransferase AbiEii toxin of type IV toxin-antitoxin system